MILSCFSFFFFPMFLHPSMATTVQLPWNPKLPVSTSRSIPSWRTARPKATPITRYRSIKYGSRLAFIFIQILPLFSTTACKFKFNGRPFIFGQLAGTASFNGSWQMLADAPTPMAENLWTYCTLQICSCQVCCD